jgi:hypothetical protein
MKATTLYRIASVFFLLFAAGRTLGFLSLGPPSENCSARVLRQDERRSFSGERRQLQLWRFLQRVWAEHHGPVAVLRVSGLAFGNSCQQ